MIQPLIRPQETQKQVRALNRRKERERFSGSNQDWVSAHHSIHVYQSATFVATTALHWPGGGGGGGGGMIVREGIVVDERKGSKRIQNKDDHHELRGCGISCREKHKVK